MSKLRAGDWVEVRSKEEILRTLDKNGRLDGLPFMPGMFRFCGKRFKVYKRAHKTCDTVSGDYVGRGLKDGIHLDLRCDGHGYDGCQAACLIFWKQDWLKPVGGPVVALRSPEPTLQSKAINDAGCTEEDVWKATRRTDRDAGGETRYVCQATELLRYTTPIKWWHFGQYVEDYTSGNATLRRLFSGSVYACYSFISRPGRTLGPPLRWLYNRFQALRGGLPFPRMVGTIPPGAPTPTADLNLQPGDLVRVKSHEEILATLDTNAKNRGLYFDGDMVPYCGGIYRVRARVSKFVDEKNGKMASLKSPAVILDGACCQSRYSLNRMYCPRSILAWWREVWLEKVPESTQSPTLSVTTCPSVADGDAPGGDKQPALQ